MKLPYMHRVSDRAGLASGSRYRHLEMLPSASAYGVGARESCFRGSIPGLHVPLSTLPPGPCGPADMTRGHRGSLALRCRTPPFLASCRFIPARHAGHLTQVPPHSEAERRSRAALAERAAAAAWEQGLRMDLQAAVGFARAMCGDPPSRPLAPRKMQIVRLVAGGFSDKEIAQRLSI